MKTKIFFAIFILISSTNSFAQYLIPVKQIDSIFQTIQVSDNDWAIGLSIEQAGTIPLFDSLGNAIDEDPLGTFLLLKIGNDYFLQKIWYDYTSDKFEQITGIGNRLKLSREINLNYTVDSIRLTENESIYPFIYKDDSLGIYCLQSPANHEPHYGLYFKTTKNGGYVIRFTETDLKEMYFLLHAKNLNYTYNSRTFTYRAFHTLNSLIKKHLKDLAR